jgi:hypothetical protein
MSDRTATVVVTSDDTLPEIVERLHAAGSGGRAVYLVVPIDSALLLTTNEFRALKDAIDEHRLAVQLRTSDPLRLHLAERLGIRAHALPRPRIAVAPVAPRSTEAPIAPGEDNGSGISEAIGIAPALDPESHWPNQNGPAAVTDEADADSEAAPEIADATGSENPPRRWAPVAAALAIIVALAFFAIRFVLPQAVITITPKTAPVAAAIAFDVTSDGQPIADGAAFALAAQPREIEVAWSGTVPTTGVRVEPDGTASGPIELRNATGEPLVADAGTVVITESDIEFAFTEAVTVPAADPTTGRPGAATGNVRAVQPGSGGNIATGEIGGRLPNGVYYSNRMEPTGGGTDKEFPAVAQADLDALSEAAVADAPGLAAEVLASEHPGAVIVPANVTVSDRHDEFDRQVGEDADSVSLHSTLTVQLLTYDGDAAASEYQQVLAGKLNGEAPEGFAVSPDEIAYTGPTTIDSNDRGVRLEIAAEADAEAVLDDAERAALTAELAGAGPEQTAAILARFPEIAQYTIEYHPMWLPRQMPANAGRIQLELAE